MISTLKCTNTLYSKNGGIGNSLTYNKCNEVLWFVPQSGWLVSLLACLAGLLGGLAWVALVALVALEASTYILPAFCIGMACLLGCAVGLSGLGACGLGGLVPKKAIQL